MELNSKAKVTCSGASLTISVFTDLHLTPEWNTLTGCCSFSPCLTDKNVKVWAETEQHSQLLKLGSKVSLFSDNRQRMNSELNSQRLAKKLLRSEKLGLRLYLGLAPDLLLRRQRVSISAFIRLLFFKGYIHPTLLAWRQTSVYSKAE